MSEDPAAPQPRPLPMGLVDRLLGPGASSAEVAAAAAAALAGALLGALTVEAPLLPTLVLALITADTTGGIVANLNPSGKRWQHRPGIGRRHQLMFVAGHGVHLALFVWLFRGGDPQLFLAAWLLLLVAAALVLQTPAAARRGVALVATLACLLLLRARFDPVQEAAWFLPLLYAKLLIAYLPAPRPEASV